MIDSKIFINFEINEQHCGACKYYSKYLMECYYKYDEDDLIIFECHRMERNKTTYMFIKGKLFNN